MNEPFYNIFNGMEMPSYDEMEECLFPFHWTNQTYFYIISIFIFFSFYFIPLAKHNINIHPNIFKGILHSDPIE